MVDTMAPVTAKKSSYKNTGKWLKEFNVDGGFGIRDSGVDAFHHTVIQIPSSCMYIIYGNTS
jgi:hypothetical protein